MTAIMFWCRESVASGQFSSWQSGSAGALGQCRSTANCALNAQSERPLGRGYDAPRPRIRRHRHAQCACERLEYGLRLVMRIRAAQVVEVHGHEGVIDESLEEFVREIDVERADQRARERNVEFEAGPPRKIDHRAR